MKRLMIAGACALAAGCGDDRTRDGALPEWASGPAVEVIGRAYIELPPNRAEFGVSFEATADSSAEASRMVIERAIVAAQAIREIAGDQALIITSLDVEPYYEQVTVQVGEFEEELVENEHPDALLGYVATADVEVELRDPTLASEARGAALAASPTNAGSIYFSLEPDAEQQRAVYQAAVEDADARARAAAAATGRSLKRTLLVQEGTGSCLGYLTSPAGRVALEGGGRGRESVMVTGVQRGLFDFAQDAAGATLDFGELAARAGDYALSADPAPQRLTATVCAVYAVR
jgi:uncharacterized protein YggE